MTTSPTDTDTGTPTSTERTGRDIGRPGDQISAQYGFRRREPARYGRVLVAGIGNIFLGDDGFGVEVALRLAGEAVPAGITVTEFGIRGLHLAYEVLDGYDVLVLIDAMPIGEAPGTVALVEAEMPTEPPAADPDTGAPAVDAHAMSPAAVLASLAHLGGSVDRVLVVACQPATVAEGIGLSDAVAAAVEPAATAVLDLLADLAPVNPTQPTETNP